MQGNGDDDVGVRQQIPAPAAQPASEGGRQIQPVGMLQGQNRAPALFVVAHNSPGLVEGGRTRVAGRA